jgi:hypothetical protein
MFSIIAVVRISNFNGAVESYRGALLNFNENVDPLVLLDPIPNKGLEISCGEQKTSAFYNNILSESSKGPSRLRDGNCHGASKEMVI